MIGTVCEPRTGTQAKPSLDDVESIWFAMGSPSPQRRFFTPSSRRPSNSCGLLKMKERISLLPAAMAIAGWANGFLAGLHASCCRTARSAAYSRIRQMEFGQKGRWLLHAHMGRMR